ncbi:MAG: hypothetical protein V1936_02660 [Patescibacteria group bacterium]
MSEKVIAGGGVVEDCTKTADGKFRVRFAPSLVLPDGTAVNEIISFARKRVGETALVTVVFQENSAIVANPEEKLAA